MPVICMSYDHDSALGTSDKINFSLSLFQKFCFHCIDLLLKMGLRSSLKDVLKGHAIKEKIFFSFDVSKFPFELW